MALSPARSAAFRLLCRLHDKKDDSTPLPVLLEEARHGLAPRDASLCGEIVYGVLREETGLFAALAPFLKKPEALPPHLRLVLVMAAYELAELDSVPPRATLDQAVTLARMKFGRLSGLVNAVLRRACREEAFAHLPEKGTVPPWLAALWRRDYGEAEALRFERLSSLRPRPALRFNALTMERSAALRERLRQSGALFFDDFGCLLPLGAEAGGSESAVLMAAVEQARQEGLLSRQGTASQKLARRAVRSVEALRSRPSFLMWDACCGRGGKSCALREWGVPLLCSDPSERRLSFLKEDAARLGFGDLLLVQGEAQKIAAEHPAAFDALLLDAPCSGSGTLARNPELKLRLDAAKLEAAARLQRELLDAVWPTLKRGGVLIYGTCALNKAENEEQISAFLARSSDAVLESQDLLLPESEAEEGQDILFHAVLRKE